MVKDEIINALYVINKAAKQERDKDSTIGDVRKDALYAVKSDVLKEIYPSANKIEIHRLSQTEDTEYYYFDFDKTGFHAKKDSMSIDESLIESRKNLYDFSTSSDIDKTDMNLTQAITIIQSLFNIHPNEYLETEYVQTNYEYEYTGWSES